jgi:hypothetical protein
MLKVVPTFNAIFRAWVYSPHRTSPAARNRRFLACGVARGIGAIAARVGLSGAVVHQRESESGPNAEELRLPHRGSFRVTTGHPACIDHGADH